MELSRLTNITGLQFFLGLVAFVRKFIPNCSKLIAPLTALIEKGVKFKWNLKREKNFEELKKRLISAPLLQYPDPQKPYQLVGCARPCYWSCSQDPYFKKTQVGSLWIKNAIKIRTKLPFSRQGTVCNCPHSQEMAVLLGRDQASDNSYRYKSLESFKAQSKLNRCQVG